MDDIRQSLELNAKQVLDELERLKTGFTSYNDRLSTTANRLDSVADSAKRTLATLRDLRTEARLVERAMGSIGMGTRGGGIFSDATSKKVSGGVLLGGKDASKAFDEFFVNANRAQAVAAKTGQSVSQAFDQIHRDAMTKFVPASKAVKSGTESMWLSWQTFARVVQTQLFVRGINAVRDAFTESAAAAMEFSSNVSNIRAINPERTYGEIAASVRAMSDSFNQSLETVSRAQLEVISDQFSDTADMVNILTAANKLAKSTGEDLVPTAQLLTGALNAYGESADMAGLRASQFFKTIDLGRLKSGELATALGRVQSIGNSLGVEMEELDAALAAITIGGVKSNEAATQLRGVLVGLLKPTEDMKKAFDKLGIESGPLAIKTFGLAGALEKLISTTDGSANSVAGLFQNQRALAGVLRLVNTGAEAYAKSLEEIYDVEQKFLTEKLGERMKTDAERLTEATNQLKNFWTAEFGADVVEKLNTVIQLVGGGAGMVGAFRRVTDEAPKAAIAIGLVAAATARWGLAADVATAKFTKGVGLGISKIGTLGNALAVFGAYEILMAAGDTIATKISSHWSGPIKTARENMLQLIKEDQEQSEARLRLKQRETAELIRNLRQHFAEANVQYLRDRGNFVASAKAQEEAAKSAFDRIMQKRRAMQSDLENMAAEAATKATEAIPREIEGLENGLQQRKFQEWLGKTFDATEQFAPLERQLREELDLATELQATAKDTAQEQRATDAWARVEAYRQQAVEAAKLSGNTNSIRAASLLQEEIDRRRIDALREQGSLQGELATSLEQRSIQAAKHTAELDALRALAESQLETTVKTAEGGYRDKTSAELKRDIAQSESTIAQFKALLTKYSSEDFTAAFMGDTRAFTSLRREAARVLASQDIQTLTVAPETVGKLQADLQASFDKMVFELPGIVVVAKYAGADLDVVGPDAAMDAATEKLKQQDAQRSKYAQGMKDMTAANAEFEKSLGKAWSKLPTTADLHGLDTLLLKLNKARQDTDLTKEELVALLNAAKQADYGKVFGFWSEMSEGRHFGLQGAKANTEFQQSIQSMLEFLRLRSQAQAAMKDAAPDMAPAVRQEADAVRGVLAELEKTKVARDDIVGKVEREIDAQGQLTRALTDQNQLLRDRAQLQGQSRGMAFGGYFASGGYPRGSDTIPAMLSPGEFVVNAASSRKFASQLIALNAGVQPAYRNEGGSVTNVGDIHVNVNGGGTSRQTAREIANELRREIRRGTVRL